MIFSSLRKKLKDTSISRKLYFTIGIMAVLVVVELTTLGVAINTLSAVRSFVEGEALWSKSQKDAVYRIRIYSSSHNEKDFQAFRQFLAVPLGDKKALIELSKGKPDFKIAKEGLLAGRNHPDDLDGMINLIMRFSDYYYLRKAFDIWEHADVEMQQLIPLADKMHDMIRSKNASQSEINQVMDQIEAINGKLSQMVDGFSYTLGEVSRWLERTVLKVLLALSLTIGTISILITISVSRGIEKGIKAIIDGAALIKQGFFSTRVQVYSNDEIGVLASAFNDMTVALENKIQELKSAEESLKKERDRAEASEKVKQLFLANMSHEIRTPMNAILGFARLLEESLTDKELQEYIRVIIKSGDDLLVILNDILDFSRIEAGKVNFEMQSFNLKNTIDSIVTMMEPKAFSKKIKLKSTIDKQIPKIIIGDSVRLSQVILNLVSNAIKFSENGEISIAIATIDEDADKIVVECIVKDTGIGIPLEKQAKIFESFEQATTDTVRKFGGTGLGLSISKQLVELQGGKIFVKSELGSGSEFHFTLPFLKAKNGQLKRALDHENGVEIIHTPGKSGKGIRVLVVEDNGINQMLIVKVLQKREFEIDVADNGMTALDMLKGKEYDIILMDLQMPEMDGYEATRLIRNLENNKKGVPIVAMTAHTIKGERERCIEMGMNDYVPKPFNIEELFDKMFNLVKNRFDETSII
ncbi:response regulator [Mucilaginibacter corticis]|uniref:histidine kinase n=2 Tax=Mucilaginibacter corticis TaxID=2597670 RepID=A0A556MBM5_9SPHI|nr:response regulator [Mucilaginibacter corticis]